MYFIDILFQFSNTSYCIGQSALIYSAFDFVLYYVILTFRFTKNVSLLKQGMNIVYLLSYTNVSTN